MSYSYTPAQGQQQQQYPQYAVMQPGQAATPGYPHVAYGQQAQEAYPSAGNFAPWPGYAYYPSAQQYARAPPPAAGPVTSGAPPPAGQATFSAPAPAAAPLSAPASSTTTFSSYNPSYVRDRDAAASTSGGGTGARGSRRQSQLKGLFSKEREWPSDMRCRLFSLWAHVARSAACLLLPDFTSFIRTKRHAHYLAKSRASR